MSQFIAIPTFLGERIQLMDGPLAIPFDDWSLAAPLSAVPAVARIMQSWSDNETTSDGTLLVNPEGDALLLNPAFAASLSDPEAISLGLPPTAKLSLALESEGLLHRIDFRIKSRWLRPNGLPALVKVEGVRVRYDQQDWRIPEPLWSVYQATQDLGHELAEPDRFAGIAQLRALLGEELGDRLRPDGYLEQLRLHYAAGFSLDLRPAAQGIDFDPVLFSKGRLREAHGGAVLDQESDMLLPPVVQNDFAQRFRNSDGNRRAYALQDGSILFLDPALKSTLNVVHTAQRKSPAERQKFASNPVRVISDALQSTINADALFVETQQFSQRVLHIDVWRMPVMPWIKPKPNSWLPEKFGLRIGEGEQERIVEVKLEELPHLINMVSMAMEEPQAPPYVHEGQEIPATPQTLQALKDLAALNVAAEAPDAADQAPPPELRQRYFLQVRDNLEAITYAPLAPTAIASLKPVPFPSGMRHMPKDHQVVGFSWLAACWQAGVPGALLADDMGLGKTFQAISLLHWLRTKEPTLAPALIVAPTGLLANWRNEIAAHIGDGGIGRLVNAYGSDLASMRDGQGRDIDHGTSHIRPELWQNAGVVLTTYETMRDYHVSFARQPFSVIIYDEAQKMKNPASQTTRAAKTLNGRFHLAMTGTPVENRLQDLWSVMDVIHPGLLGSSKYFESSYPSENGTKLKQLHDFLALPQAERPPLMLRRMKDDCLPGLPQKRVVRLPNDMPATQAHAYGNVIVQAMAARDDSKRGYMLEILHKLRGVSLHPLDPEQGSSDPQYFEKSARLKAMLTLLTEIHTKGEKVLIFCESLALQALLAVELQRRFGLAHSILRIHGGITGEARQKAVDTFQQRGPGFDIMLLSPKAGGVGITLTAANHVIHLSRWWNPAVEDQATDRVFRIGQQKDVTVYLPQAVHPDPNVKPFSFDLKLDALMERKRALSRGLLVAAEDESDTKALFDGVLGEIMPVDDSYVTAAPIDAAPLADIVAVPNPIRNTAPRSAYVLRYGPNERRDYEIFAEPIRKEHLLSIEIRDPYSCANSYSRGHLIDFLQLLIKSASKIDRVMIVCFDAESVEARNETDKQQRADLLARWEKQLPNQPRPSIQLRSKRTDRYFHDRYVTIHSASGRKFEWMLGSGIDGFMGLRKECGIAFVCEDVG